MTIEDQVIRIWMIVYDGNADRIYSFTNFEKAVASIDGSVRSYFGEFGENEDPDFDIICSQVTEKMYELRDAPCVPMKFKNLQVVIYNWEIDDTNPIHKMLIDCHGAINDPTLKGRIESLFSDSVR